MHWNAIVLLCISFYTCKSGHYFCCPLPDNPYFKGMSPFPKHYSSIESNGWPLLWNQPTPLHSIKQRLKQWGYTLLHPFYLGVLIQQFFFIFWSCFLWKAYCMTVTEVMPWIYSTKPYNSENDPQNVADSIAMHRCLSKTSHNMRKQPCSWPYETEGWWCHSSTWLYNLWPLGHLCLPSHLIRRWSWMLSWLVHANLIRWTVLGYCSGRMPMKKTENPQQNLSA